MRSLLRFLGFGRPAAFLAPAPMLTLGAGATLAQIERAEGLLLKRPQVPYKLTHLFAPGVYVRTVIVPAGCDAVGHEHTTEHVNFLLRGRVLVLCGGRVDELMAPCVFVAAPGVRKVVRTLEETEWANVHPTTETDLAKIEAAFVKHSATFELHASEVAALDAAAAGKALA